MATQTLNAKINDEWFATDIPAHLSDYGIWGAWLTELQLAVREVVPSFILVDTPEGVVDMYRVDHEHLVEGIDWDKIFDECPAADVVARFDD